MPLLQFAAWPSSLYVCNRSGSSDRSGFWLDYEDDDNDDDNDDDDDNNDNDDESTMMSQRRR